MLKGGYQILNFDGFDFIEGISINIPNIFKKLSYTEKAVMISGLTVNSIRYRDTFVDANYTDNNFVINVYNFNISIDNNDDVVIRKISDNANIIIPIGSEPANGVYIAGCFNIAKSAINNATPLVVKFGDTLYIPFYLADVTIDSGGADTNIYGCFNDTEFSPKVITITREDVISITSY